MVLGLAEAIQPALSDRYRLRFATRSYTTDVVLFTSIVHEEHKEHYLEIRQRSNDQLVVWLDLVSPANRTTTVGRAKYQEAIQLAKKQNSHLVEMDLVLEGATCLSCDRSTLADQPYCVSIWRAGRAANYEIHGLKLNQRLPRLRVPLAADDRDLTVDLQVIFNRVYDRHHAGQIDYSCDPSAPLSSDDLAWVRSHLRTQGLRAAAT
jgi:hypothetical protein